MKRIPQTFIVTFYFLFHATALATHTHQNIPMWGTDHVFVDGTTQDTVNLETSGLNGCTATVGLIKYHNGGTCYIMTHFPPINRNDHNEALHKHINLCNQTAKSDVSSSHLIVMVPEQYYEPDWTERWKYNLETAQTKRSVRQLIETLKKNQKSGTTTTSVIPYDQHKKQASEQCPDVAVTHNTLLCTMCDPQKIEL